MNSDATVTKEKLKVYLKLADGQRLLGFFFVESTERLQDILNDARSFLPLHALGDNGKYQLIMVSKSFIQQVEEVAELPNLDAGSDRRSADRRTGQELRQPTAPKFELD